MKNFCSLVNLSSEAQGRIPWVLFHDTMTSVMYRLLGMHFHADSPNEALRLGLLAFCSQVFLQWKFVSITYGNLRTSYINCLKNQATMTTISPRLSLWLFMIGGISLFEPCDQPWMKLALRDILDSSGITSWLEAQDVLQSFMWISLVQEDRGKEIFDYTLVSLQNSK